MGMSGRRKTWAFFDENDKYLFMTEEVAKWDPKIGTKVQVNGVDYSVWYIEYGKGGNKIRLELDSSELRR